LRINNFKFKYLE